jgi:hypothetical protein
VSIDDGVAVEGGADRCVALEDGVSKLMASVDDDKAVERVANDDNTGKLVDEGKAAKRVVAAVDVVG